jgi:hypothetical protein
MILLRKFLLLTTLSSVASLILNTNRDLKSLIKALDVVIKDQYVGKVWNLDFYIFGENCERFGMKLVGDLMKNKSEGFKSEIHFIKNIQKSKIILQNSAIIIVDTIKTLNEINKKIDTVNVDYLKFQHVIVILSSKIEPLEWSKLHITFNHHLNNVLFIYKMENYYVLMQTRWFEDKDCMMKSHSNNGFSIKNQSWDIYDFNFEKINDYNGCKVSTLTQEMSSLEGLLEMVASKMNFKVAKPSLENDMNHFTIFLTHIPRNFSLRTSHYFYEFTDIEMTYIISLGETYTSYEKFYLPFDLETWICCGIFFGGAFLIIFIINKTKNRQIQQIVYGSRVQSPAMNVLIAFFGQSQNVLPSRSFARFILMMFIIFCLIIRTGYQGVQFNLMYKVSYEEQGFQNLKI